MLCPTCGSLPEESSPGCSAAAAPGAPQKPAPCSGKNRRLLFAAIGSGFLLLLVLLLFCLSDSKLTPIRYYYSGLERGSLSEFEKAFPGRGIDAADFYKFYQHLCAVYGGDFRLDYTIRKETRLDDAALETLAEKCAEGFDLPKSEITDAYTVSFFLTVSGEKDSAAESSALTVFEYGGHWYLYPVPANGYGE
jgi:hypothetical protein